jgi:hypothetical protein
VKLADILGIKREYINNNNNSLATRSKNKNTRDLFRAINEFKKGYQPRTNFVKDKKRDLVADSRNIFNR